MRRLRVAWRAASAALGILLAAATSVGAAEKRIVTDAAGRRVEVPTRIERVYAAGGPASLLVYALAPEKLLGWVRPLTPDERAYPSARFAELPDARPADRAGNTAVSRSCSARGRTSSSTTVPSRRPTCRWRIGCNSRRGSRTSFSMAASPPFRRALAAWAICSEARTGGGAGPLRGARAD